MNKKSQKLLRLSAEYSVHKSDVAHHYFSSVFAFNTMTSYLTSNNILQNLSLNEWINILVVVLSHIIIISKLKLLLEHNFVDHNRLVLADGFVKLGYLFQCWKQSETTRYRDLWPVVGIESNMITTRILSLTVYLYWNAICVGIWMSWCNLQQLNSNSCGYHVTHNPYDWP